MHSAKIKIPPEPSAYALLLGGLGFLAFWMYTATNRAQS